MTNILAITILKEMQEGIKATGNLTKDVEALDIAIKELEGTAPEVPVQEQLKKRKILLIQSLGKEKFESIVDVVNSQIKKNNLDVTPTILKDLFEYLIIINCFNL